ncbi:hypothetical protein SSS_03748 [Sarcoptes scabiei]|uniref:Uncharacterized protein n=1 Tax=Sarcoptes scabiei TaxID=52283 RepID=A0A834RAF3_SARSC|nr:hypothetical protein SSS_03748 [Sarcoptes scabiei]
MRRKNKCLSIRISQLFNSLNSSVSVIELFSILILFYYHITITKASDSLNSIVPKRVIDDHKDPLDDVDHISHLTLTNQHHSIQCIFGHLQLCNDDEDCVELEHQPVHEAQDEIKIIGECICRDVSHCKRNAFFDSDDERIDQISIHPSMIADQSSTNARSSSISLLISVLILALIILIVLLSSTISIYYCHKHHHLSTRNLLQSFCFRSGNSRIEDNQLLNQIASNRLGEEEDDEDDNIQFSL